MLHLLATCIKNRILCNWYKYMSYYVIEVVLVWPSVCQAVIL